MLKTLQQTYPDLIIKENEPLSYYTYTKTGGKADIIVFPKTKVEVQQVIEYAKEHQIPLTVIGNASNLIVRDGGIRGDCDDSNGDERNNVRRHKACCSKRSETN